MIAASSLTELATDPTSAYFPFILTLDLVPFAHNQKFNSRYQEISKMSITVVLSATVPDFNKWKILFDEDEDKRVKGGIHATPHRDLDDPTRLCIISEAPSKEAFMTLFRDPELQKRRLSVGVVEPDIKFLEKI